MNKYHRVVFVLNVIGDRAFTLHFQRVGRIHDKRYIPRDYWLDRLSLIIDKYNFKLTDPKNGHIWMYEYQPTAFQNMLYSIALEHCEDIELGGIDSVDDLQQYIFDEDMHTDLIEDIGTKSWTMIDWDRVLKALKNVK